MTASVPRGTDSWTFEDLHALPEDGKRYELIDGRLLVSPQPAVLHYGVVNRLHELLVLQGPKHLIVGQNGGVLKRARKDTYLVPDILVTPMSALKGPLAVFDPKDAVLVVEVLSPGSRKNDNVTKRHYYGWMGVPHYWIVDPIARQLSVMTLDADNSTYRDVVTVEVGEEWRTEEPFPVTLDPAEFC
ncbi:Uma2 family endonuclease [Virgisporangium aurantiacum]|nr:Uma2 family endonuclease [Virgisporangium aurantiacum]